MIRSRLFLRLFSAIIGAVALFSLAIYVFSVPLIKQTTYEIELNASRTILDNVFGMASRINGTLEDQRRLTVAAYEEQLRTVVSLAAAHVEDVFARMERGEITRAQADQLVYDGLRSFKYGDNNYVWMTDYNSVLRSHPDPDFQGRNASDLRDEYGVLILPTIIAIARAKGDGIHTYNWRRLGEKTLYRKMSYFKDLPKWGLVIGTGAYLDDIDAAFETRKAAAIDDLREALRTVRIARTGYIYIFDAANHMIIHPNANIEGREFSEMLDPATGQRISEELKAVADTSRPMTYRWDKPDDPGHYAYEKISWVRHFPGFDWYIASSVYVEELTRSSVALGNRLLFLSLAVLVLAAGLAYWGVMRLVRPLNQLAETAEQVQGGNLNAASGIIRNDEIGTLAAAFDAMIARLRDTIGHLDSRVHDRTLALEDANARQREAQQRLAQIEARQRLILDAIPASIAYFDQAETMMFVNRRWAEMVLRRKEAIIGQPLAEMVGRRAYQAMLPWLERTRAGEDVSFDYSYHGPDGRMVVTRNSLIPQLSPQDDVTGMFVLSLDVTDERETARQLQEAQRLQAVGQLAGGLAHDFNNLLSVILGNLAVARERYGAIDGLDDYLDPACRASRRGADITARLLTFARRHPQRPSSVDIRALTRETAVLLRRSLPSSIVITSPEDGAPGWAFIDQTQLENALVNLALNARDAMPQGGALTITLEDRQVDGLMPLTLDEPVPPGHYIAITVGDTGSGIAAEALPRVFDPFFTTKQLGSGLGLSMVYGFVKQSGGFIALDSVIEQGTAVTILLPAAAPAADPGQPDTTPVQADPSWRGLLALLAEDSSDVRQVMRQHLVDCGFAVIEAADGTEAASLLDGVDGISLLVSDIVMPGMSGLDLARHVKSRHPRIAVVLATGFSVEETEGLADLIIIRKPWDKKDLLRAIRQAMERSKTAEDHGRDL